MKSGRMLYHQMKVADLYYQVKVVKIALVPNKSS